MSPWTAQRAMISSIANQRRRIETTTLTVTTATTMIVVFPLEDKGGALQLADEGGFWGQPVDKNERGQRKVDFENRLFPSKAARDAANTDALTEDQAEEIMQRIHDVVKSHMPNSSLSRFAQGWAMRIGNMLSQRLPTVAMEAPSISGLRDVAVPAPGYHDARAFPEFCLLYTSPSPRDS